MPNPLPASSQIPRGVGLPPPPGMDPKKGKLMCIKVRMLDDTTAVFHLGHKATGQALFDEVCRHLNLLESDYFGLEFIDAYGNKVWLDKDKSILRQVTSTQSDARFYFIVKFYTPNPADLEEEYTRFLISLQIRRDLAQGEFVCNENTAALLVAYIVQADCGDFSPEDYPDHTYLSPINFIPHQTVAFQIKVMENHKQLIGMTPGEADLAMLEIARRCDFYGIKLHIAKDIEGTDVNLSVAHMGVKVFHHLQCVSIFSWAKIRKISFKRKKLMLKLHPESNPYYKETVEFSFDTRNEAKNFWKKCVEHHAFFRCTEIPEPKKENKFFTRGSSFRYHGRTQKQLIDYVREHHKRREPFSRPIRPSNSRSGSAQRHIQFNVIDATTGSLTRRSQTASSTDDEKIRINNDNGNLRQFGPVYYPPGVSQPQNPMTIVNPQKSRPKSVQVSSKINYGSDNERNCVSDMETTNKDYYIQQKSFKIQPKQETIQESAVQTSFVDPMSVSLPNVLGDDIKIICREFELQKESRAPKSASGDNFLEQVNNPNAQFDFYLDNMSEGSYKLHDQDHPSSSQSDVGSSATDPRVYSTTFTTKRVGNVLVKKVTGQKQRHRSENDDDDSSGYSDYPRTKSAPGSKYAQVMRQSLAAGGMARFRDAVPIPIDGPGVTPGPSSQAPVHPSNIIRPVVLSPVYQKSPFEQEKRAVIQQIPSISQKSEESKYSAVHRIRQIPTQSSNLTTFSPSTDTGFRSIAATEKLEETKEGSSEKEEAEEKKGKPTTYGATGPIKGKVIHKENLVITPEGITVREAILRKEKPAVPPKPKNITLISSSASGQESSKNEENSKNQGFPKNEENSKNQGFLKNEENSKNQGFSKNEENSKNQGFLKNEENSKNQGFLKNQEPPVPPPKPKTEITISESVDKGFEKLLEPLDSILKDAEELTVLSQGKQISENQDKKKLEKPTLISVSNEDTPDVQKLHLLNGEIPYTLTMRNIDRGTQQSPNLSTFGPSTSGDEQSKTIDLKHRKTFDLVHRRRLPSQDSFSSQDHSISPTTPETGNVVDYVMRRRSLSSDRYPISKSKGNQKRNDPRRQTQPVVRFGETTVAEPQVPVVKPESDEDNELPDPPTVLNPSNPENVKFADESNSKENSNEKLNEPSTNRTETGILWTDF